MSHFINKGQLPKHLQHERLKREEDDEQWISGEELCTEGSSDEETETESPENMQSASRRIYKSEYMKNIHLTENAKSDLSEENFKKINISSHDSTDKNQPKSSIHWRPQKGAQKLPEIEKGVKALCNKKELVTNITQQLNTLDNKSCKSSESEDSNIDIFDEIEIMQKKLTQSMTALENQKKHRLKFEMEVCDSLKMLNTSAGEINDTRKFFKIVKYDANKKKNDNKKDFSKLNTKKRRKINSYLKKPTNIHKQLEMINSSSLTDEEKTRLILLLSDIEVDEQGDTKSDNEVTNKTNDKGFQFVEDDLRTLASLDEKLKTLQEMCDDADLKGKSSRIVVSTDEENREWKEYLKIKNERVREIDNQLSKFKETKNDTEEN